MRIEYKISFENGAMTISHRVEPDVASSKPTSGSNAAAGVRLGVTFAASQGGGGTDPGGKGGGGTDPGGKGGGGTDLGGKGGGGTDPGGKGGGGTEQGQVVVFGPIVIDASGLLLEKKAQKPEQ